MSSRTSGRRAATTQWEHVTYAESDDKPGVEYEIMRRPDGFMKCACESFRFARGEFGTPSKTCKHIRTWRTGGDVANGQPVFVQRLVQPGPLVRGAKVAGETFTFRRAMGALRP